MEPIGLMHISTVKIPVEFIESIYKEFVATGKKGFERLALLVGLKSGPDFLVTHVLYPEQELVKSPRGLSFYVGGEELERIWDWLYDNKCTLIGQIHSHPSEAYHSQADDEMAIITTFGGISIVVPDFGRSDRLLEKSAFYRLLPGSGWTLLSKDEVSQLIKLIH